MLVSLILNWHVLKFALMYFSLFKDFVVLIFSEFQISRVKGDSVSIYLGGGGRRADLASDAARPEFKHQVSNILAARPDLVPRPF